MCAGGVEGDVCAGGVEGDVLTEGVEGAGGVEGDVCIPMAVHWGCCGGSLHSYVCALGVWREYLCISSIPQVAI